VLCGDLNTPRREHPDGTVWSFARDGHGRLRPERAGAWDEAELGIVPGLAELGMTDCFRALNGYASREPSWTWRRWGGGYRLDHVFVSAELEPVDARYHHDWRDNGLSDHSALEVVLRSRSQERPATNV
jgi:endonuclease/exonuclease/phosphatase family metal-dependent hydrolase